MDGGGWGLRREGGRDGECVYDIAALDEMYVEGNPNQLLGLD